MRRTPYAVKEVSSDSLSDPRSRRGASASPTTRLDTRFSPVSGLMSQVSSLKSISNLQTSESDWLDNVHVAESGRILYTEFVAKLIMDRIED